MQKNNSKWLGKLDNHGKPWVKCNCSKCGRWVSKDGFCNFVFDSKDGWEMDEPICFNCRRKDTKDIVLVALLGWFVISFFKMFVL